MPTKNDLIKSRKRVKDHGEVYTPPHIVKDMCDLLPTEMWETPFKTFLEPCCGNGNFLVEILDRKLKYCNGEKDGLRALASIYGLDLLNDNVLEARNRLFQLFVAKFPTSNKQVQYIACLIIKNNIVQSDTLKTFEIYEKQEGDSIAEFMRIAKEIGGELNGDITHHR